MLKISSTKPETFVLDASSLEKPLNAIPGVFVTVKPITTAAVMAARSAATRTRRELLEQKGIAIPEDSEEASALIVGHPDVLAGGNYTYTRWIAVAGIVAWTGIVDERECQLPVTEANIDAVLQVPDFYDFIDRKYVSPSLELESEKNASSPSLSTTSSEGAPIATVAETATEDPAPNALTS